MNETPIKPECPRPSMTKPTSTPPTIAAPSEVPLLSQFRLFASIGFRVFLIGGTTYAAFVAYAFSRLDKKLGAIYSKSSPHYLERYNHLYVKKRLASEALKDVHKLYEEEEEVASSQDENNNLGPASMLLKLGRWGLSFFDRLREEAIKRDIDGKVKVLQDLSNGPADLLSIMRGKRDDANFLIRMINSDNPIVWKYALEALVKMPHYDWRDDDFWRVAQMLNATSISAISQHEDVDLRFFLPFKSPYGDNKGELFWRLRDLVGQLPVDSSSEAAQYFTEQAVKTIDTIDSSPAGDEDDGICYDGSFLGGEHLEYNEAVRHISMTPRDKQEYMCLEALVHLSRNRQAAALFLQRQIIPVLQKLVCVKDCHKLNVLVAEIIGNVACSEEAVTSLIHAGWVGLLVKWRQSQESPFPLKLAAARALVNFFVNTHLRPHEAATDQLEDGVYAYEPFYGFFTTDFVADIVFVHGLLGGAAYTWRQSDDAYNLGLVEDASQMSSCWPKDWLRRDVKDIRMMGVEYYTQLTDWEHVHPYETKEQRTLHSRAKELLRRLEAAGIGKRPIIWVSHSMGGLLVKELLRIATDRNPADMIVSNTTGVVFYAVPHRGSPLADLGQHLFYVAFPTIEVQELSYTFNKEYLDELNNFFAGLVEKGIHCLSFGELKPTYLGDYVSDYASTLLVPPDSADPGYGQFIPVDSDHMNICKPITRDTYLYTMTRAFIQDCVERKRVEKALQIASKAILKEKEEYFQLLDDMSIPIGWNWD